MNDDTIWVASLDKLIKKLRLVSSFGLNHKFSPDGANALAELLEQMAIRLDSAVTVVGRPNDCNDKRPYSDSAANVEPS